ncbi:unnamed protein product [Adineta ricciae]|uniref:C2H2-type domain-containing protein n=1 Tax=Adineta ricciae TaxID=249248 RepID=A0A814VKF2_ADIRI|nr:unnamed protein product [Adineta ricciae]CAF1188817.1 unnamed protein product [Adineta ricciae]
MPSYQPIKCAQCGMTFPNDDALMKHKSKFCVGVKDSGINRKYNPSDDERTDRYPRENYVFNRPSSKRGTKHQSSVAKKRNEVYDWKNKRSMLQNLKDMEDQAYYNSQKARKPVARRKTTNNHDHILNEYERLEAQERDILRQISNLEDPADSYTNGLTGHERNQLEALKRENARLEQERRLIQVKLKKLIIKNDQLTTVPDYEPHRILRELQDQRDQSMRNLYTLTDPLNNRRAYSTEIPSLPYLPPQRRTSGDDIRTMRNSYLQSGGHNAAVLVGYSDIERKLSRYDHYPIMRDNPEPLIRQKFQPVPPFPGVDLTSSKVTNVKNENQRLRNELDDIRRRFQGLDSRTKRLELGVGSNRLSDPIVTNDDHNYTKPRVNGNPPMNSLIHSSTRQNDHYQRANRLSSPTYNRYSPTQSFAPYDPTDGFVIFFDYISNLSTAIDRVRLITCLHHEQTGLGEPSQLDPCRCELLADELSNDTMRTAYVATKQPVPRCPPQQALKIVVEVQATSKQAPHDPFLTAAWAKMPIFDYKNSLLTGRWRISLKSLPIQHDERVSVISSLPNFGHAELHYRLVNLRDAVNQSNTTLVPQSRDLYKLPPYD